MASSTGAAGLGAVTPVVAAVVWPKGGKAEPPDEPPIVGAPKALPKPVVVGADPKPVVAGAPKALPKPVVAGADPKPVVAGADPKPVVAGADPKFEEGAAAPNPKVPVVAAELPNLNAAPPVAENISG
jgi:hypothetical protein